MIPSPSSQANLFVAQADVHFPSDQSHFGVRAARALIQLPTAWIFRYAQVESLFFRLRSPRFNFGAENEEIFSEPRFSCTFPALIRKSLIINGSAYGNRTRLSGLSRYVYSRV
jgi:hypothetical protein